jgi:hypothetical protein
VRVFAACVMSTHYHLVVQDPEGRISVFLRELNRLVAKCMNACQGRWEGFWAKGPPHLLLLGDEEDVIAKIAYVAANPVEAGLVASPGAWPGVMLLPRALARRLRAKRPAVYFGAESRAPAELVLQVAALGFENALSRVEAAIAARVSRAHARMRAEGVRFLGRAAVLAASFVKRARSYERRRKLVPVIGAQRPELRRALLAARRAYLAAYREAMAAWRAGDREVVFPWGTWWMVEFHGARVAGP